MSFSYAGLTLYAVLSGIEEDLRELIRIYITGQKEDRQVLGEELWNICIGRLEKDIGKQNNASLSQLLPYMDFGDSYQMLNSNNDSLPQHIAQYIRKITPQLEKLTPVRNRVAHSRPLNFEDFPKTMDTAQEFIKYDGIWENLKKNLARLEREPSFVLGLRIPAHEMNAKDQRHNLPVPEFNDTGYLGREKQTDEVIKRCLSPQYPVVTIVGEGGIGKTALAQKVAYNILDRPDCPYEAVVWTSSKTTQITAKEIVKIKGAISNSLGIFQDIADHLAPKGSENLLEEINEYLTTFPILLIL